MIDKNENIKARLLTPMILVGAFLIFLSLAGGFWIQNRAIDNYVNQRTSGVESLFTELLQEEAQVMSGQIDFLKTDQALVASFLAGDRVGLFTTARPLFERMRSKYRITHFYFHRPDRSCFLRVHSPDRHGDLIERFTLAGAASGSKPYYGIELGPLGTFTLRVVDPWVVNGRLVGYIELGMEIEHLTALIKQAQGVDILVLIEKKYLKRGDWEAGLKVLNRKGNWDLFHDFVIIDQTMDGSPLLDEKLRTHKMDDSSTFTVEFESRRYRGTFQDLTDTGNRRVGEIVTLVDVSAQQSDLTMLLLLMAMLSLSIGGGLFLFFNRYIGRIQNHLAASRQKLQTEIEERRRREEALAISEKRFRSLFEESKDAIVTTDQEGQLLIVNPAGMELFGLAKHEVESKNFRDFYVEPAMARRFSAAISEQGYIRDFGVQLYGNGGKAMDCLLTVTTKLSTDGAITGYEGIIRDVTPFKKMEEDLRRLATIDSLTGICNRHSFMDLAQKEMRRSRRYGHPLSFIMLDIDNFKKTNDTYGHSAGDKVLVELCAVCLKELRDSDIMGRYGGEEFNIVLVENDMGTAATVAERIRKVVASHKVINDNVELSFTISLGVTEMLPEDDLASMLKRADGALYRAKDNGRNQVRTSE